MLYAVGACFYGCHNSPAAVAVRHYSKTFTVRYIHEFLYFRGIKRRGGKLAELLESHYPGVHYLYEVCAFCSGFRHQAAELLYGLKRAPHYAAVAAFFMDGKGGRAVGDAVLPRHRARKQGDAEVVSAVAALNADPAVHGVLVQLPLTRQID